MSIPTGSIRKPVFPVGKRQERRVEGRTEDGVTLSGAVNSLDL